MNDQRSLAAQAAMMNYQYERKDPTVNSAGEARHALIKRAEALRANLAKVTEWETELRDCEAMIEAFDRPRCSEAKE